MFAIALTTPLNKFKPFIVILINAEKYICGNRKELGRWSSYAKYRPNSLGWDIHVYVVIRSIPHSLGPTATIVRSRKTVSQSLRPLFMLQWDSLISNPVFYELAPLAFHRDSFVRSHSSTLVFNGKETALALTYIAPAVRSHTDSARMCVTWKEEKRIGLVIACYISCTCLKHVHGVKTLFVGWLFATCYVCLGNWFRLNWKVGWRCVMW